MSFKKQSNNIYQIKDNNNLEDEDDNDFSMGMSMHIELDNSDKYFFEVLSTEEVVKHMLESINEVSSVIEIPPTTTRILLNYLKWNKEKLMDRFFGGNQQKLFDEAHIINPLKKKNLSNQFLAKQEECGICYLKFNSSNLTGLECGHRYCSECWEEYLTTKIMEEGMSQTVACAANSCDIIVDDTTIMQLVKNSQVKLKYQHLITNSFVECNRLLSWCPTSGCKYVIKVPEIGLKPKVRCKCYRTFCFRCKEHWHDPVNCDVLRKWIKQMADDHESLKWIGSNARECPKCSAPIKKEGGCNHIRCGNRNCNFDFCWICLGPWISRAHSECNIYRNEGVPQNVQEKNQAIIERRQFYWTRYLNHKQSLEIEIKMYNTIVLRKMTEMYDMLNISFNEVQFLNKALDTLCSSRLTLMGTYIFAHYVEKNNQTAIFEINQSNLETATEALSEYLERDITNENLAHIKEKVQDKSRYCEKRSKVLLDHVNEGYQKKWWRDFVI